MNEGSRGGGPVGFDAADYENRNVVERAFNHFENRRGLTMTLILTWTESLHQTRGGTPPTSA